MRRLVVVVGRLLLAALSLAGIVVQLGVSVTEGLGLVNFFSYFTILANLFVSVVFVVGAVTVARGREPSPAAVAVRGASTVYIVFVGIVWFAFLRGVDLGSLKPWVNAVHHIVMPIAAALEWLVWPPGRRIPRPVVVSWLAVPLVYTVYSLVRGALTGWYAYPFFNPAGQGYGAVALYALVMLAAFAVISLAVAALARRPLKT